MICSRCGKPLAPGASLCAACGAPGIAPLGGAGALAGATGAGAAPAYAGFWLRLLAYVIDSILVGFVSSFVGAFLGGILAGVLGARGTQGEALAAVAGLLGGLVGALILWLYFALMESSGTQATLGKMALGLAVTDAAGRPIGFGRATGRYFGKILSTIPLCLGFVVAGFTARKQALHDLVAGTLVVRRRKGGTFAVVAVVAAVVLGGIVVVGILAAIAIPNFVRYQLRAKASEATVHLTALHRAEVAHFQQTRRYAPLELPAEGAPGVAKLAWAPADLAAAEGIGWSVPGATWFAYRVEVGVTDDGRQAFAACAESDLDGDGTHAAFVIWQPAVDEGGKVVGLPPAPPCAHEPALERSPLFELRDPVGTPVKISPADVF
jgi:uncharacterized RDD family membrane protein YckC